MRWIYLSPHLDDVALSCGGLIWEQTLAGDRVSVWTICAGDPPEKGLSPFAQSLHARWQSGREVFAQRRLEDAISCAEISADYRHFPFLDCIYRRKDDRYDGSPDEQTHETTPESPDFLYKTEEALFGPMHPTEIGLVSRISAELSKALPKRITLVCPLTLGGHVDHQLTRAAAEQLGIALCYYAEYPYVLSALDQLEQLKLSGWRQVAYSISQQGLSRWKSAISAHRSQLSTFWSDLSSMRSAIQAYYEMSYGNSLWKPAPGEED